MTATLRDYLNALVDARQRPGAPAAPAEFKYLSPEDFVLKRGVEYESAPLNPEQAEYVRRVAKRMTFSARECFANAQRLVMAEDHSRDHVLSRRMVYCEGWAMGSVIPVHHGWVVLDGERVIDPTFLASGKPRSAGPGGIASGVLGVFAPREYIGVPLDTDLVSEIVAEEGAYLSLIDLWERDWPALRGEFDKEAP